MYNNQKVLLLTRATSPVARLLSKIIHGADSVLLPTLPEPVEAQSRKRLA